VVAAFPRLLLVVVLIASSIASHAGPSGPVAWGATVDVAGGGWGRMVQLTNGQWLVVSTLFPANTNSYLSLLRSTDSGRTWSSVSRVEEAGRQLDNGELVVLPDGHLLVTMRSLIDGTSYHLPVYRSTNNGVTWSYLSNIDTSEGLGSRGLWEPDFWVLADGRLIVTYSNEKHDGFSQLVSEKVSTDNGATWSAETTAVSQIGGGSLRPGMSQIARMADGRYILVYEVVNSGHADVHCKFSADGVDWPSGLGTKIPCQHCGPFVTALPDGRLFVTSCENEVSFSEDYGETWQKIEPPAWNLGFHFTWPAIYSTKTNEMAVMAVSPSLKLRFGSLAPPKLWPAEFSETFSDGDDDGWTRYGGNISVVAGQYMMSNSGTFGKAMTGDGFWTDGTLEADVTLTTAIGEAGLLFRTTNPDYADPDDAFGYYVGLNPNGTVVLGKMANSWTALVSASANVPLNTMLHLKVDIAGPDFRIFVNRESQPKITWTDSTFRRGQIGVRAFRADAVFDNITCSNSAPFRLDVHRAGARIDFSWPRSAFQTLGLHSATALQKPTGWNRVTNSPTLVDEKWSVSLPADSEDRFYQLIAP
jgi:hypothetical protein